MKIRTTKFLSAAVISAALIATVAIARTVHTHGSAAGAPPAQHSVLGAWPGEMARAPLHGSIACGTMSYADCQRLEEMLPM